LQPIEGQVEVKPEIGRRLAGALRRPACPKHHHGFLKLNFTKN
jgi:hypothetical protein